MPDTDLDRTLAAALHRRAATVGADPAPLERIRRRATIIRRRRQRRIGTFATAAVVAGGALVSTGIYAAHGAHTTKVYVGAPEPNTTPSRPLTQLADTTSGHSCPSIGAAQPTSPSTFIGTNAGRPGASEQVLVPGTLPAGYCATTPSTFLPAGLDSPFTVLASCAACADPTATVAVSRSTDRDTWAAQTTIGEETGTIDGRTYGYKPPTTRGGRAQLAWPKNTGPAARHSFLLIGHGLTKAQYIQLAQQLAGGRPAALPGLAIVYNGRADLFDNTPSSVDRAVTLTWVTESGRQIVTYDYQHVNGPLTATEFAWEYPGARTISTGRGTTIVYAADPEAAQYASNYLLVTTNAVIRIQYVSATPRPVPRFPVTMLEDLRPLSTASSTWTAFAAAATRHTTQTSRAVALRRPSTGSFLYTNP